MNDGEEIVWAHRQVELALTRMHDRDDIPDDVIAVPKKFLEKVREAYKLRQMHGRHFLACFSTTGDSLSQWRAYADDARGFSVGFDPSCLDVPAQLTRVEYQPDKQQEYIIRAIAAIYEESKKETYSDFQFGRDVIALYGKSASFKNPAFVDEREIRAAHMVLLWQQKGGLLGLEYSGGYVDGVAVEDAEINFRTAKGSVIPYIDFSFQTQSDCAIRELWLGPRCPNSPTDVEILLGTLGYEGVEVAVAGSKYRG